VRGLSTLLKLSTIFVFVAMFWALYDQTGSSWIQQAEDLNRRWIIDWLPAQIQAVNPIMILILIPVFDRWIYPAAGRMVTLTPIRRIGAGLFITVLSFALVATIQGWIEQGARPSVGWQILAYVIITAAEVMVSITALEFAYTQAPLKMKSIIMALFYSSVALGNQIALQVNERIQIPNQLNMVAAAHDVWYDPTAPALPTANEQARIRRSVDIYGRPLGWELLGPDAYQYVLAGTDQTAGTPDDIRVVYDRQGVRRGVVTAANDVLNRAKGIILAGINASPDATGLPESATGQQQIAGLADPWNQPLRYTLINRRTFRVTSLGPDGRILTPDDIALVTQIADAAGGDAEDQPGSWLARRQEALAGMLQSRGQQEIELDVPGMLPEVEVGGLVKLEGSSYYWFFTQLMLVTAVVFVLVGYVYQPREYLQQEESRD
jgi:POT family proton-dependent oligopeptide transporter